MIRYDFPFDGKRYLLDKGTTTLHDLANETPLCKINQIDESELQMFEEDIDLQQLLVDEECYGCYWCLRGFNNSLFE